MNPYNQPGGYPGYPAPSGGYPASSAPSGGYPAPSAPSGVYPTSSGGYPTPAGDYYQQPVPQGNYPPPSGQPTGYPPSQSQTTFGAQTPYKQPIPGGLTPGRLINITLTPGPTRFNINLRHSENGDIAFHFNPRLPEQVVVRNTQVNGGWQNEERQQPTFPFHTGQQCNIMILCEPTQFKVAVNGQHFIEYRLRTGGLQLIQLIEVAGDMTLGTLNVQ